MAIEAGKKVIIRSTGEPGMALAIREAGPVVLVRRPKSSKDGVEHVLETFYLEELQDFEDAKKEFIQEAMASQPEPSGDAKKKKVN